MSDLQSIALPDEQEINRQTQENAKRVIPIYDQMLQRFMYEQADFLTDPKESNKQKLTRLWDFGQRVSNIVTPHSACRKGCNHCCKQAVMMSSEEAKRIAQSTGRTLLSPAGYSEDPEVQILQVQDSQEQFAGKPCPMLDAAGKCSIYAVRPMVCRTYFNMSDTPELCDTEGHPHQQVPNLNVLPVIGLQVVGLTDQKWDDIRRWFKG